MFNPFKSRVCLFSLLGLAGLSVVCLGMGWYLLSSEPFELEFIDFSSGNKEDVSLVFRLRNPSRFDLHYSIETIPSLRIGERTREVGLLPADAILTNKIPILFLDRSFQLQADLFRIPVLPKQWFLKPEVSWRCLKSFLRGESRLLYSFDGTLPTNHVTRIKTLPLPAMGEE
jgi:hypothetical protein